MVEDLRIYMKRSYLGHQHRSLTQRSPNIPYGFSPLVANYYLFVGYGRNSDPSYCSGVLYITAFGFHHKFNIGNHEPEVHYTHHQQVVAIY